MNETEFIPPRRTDALDSDDGDGAETSGFVIKPESDEEKRQREQAEQQRPPPPDDDKQQTTWRRMFGRIGDAADATVKTVLLDDQERMSRPEQRFGGVVYNPRHGCIIQAIGVLTEKELGRRQEQISNSYSDNKALLAVDLPTYAVLE